ncbi:MAG: signal recognition particle-docking protein FtsY [Deltaproteobacteria bacterium]|nr:signal recognition particle-docking protein FtsY [Deltaproteobacteria bacterium]
MTEFLPLIIFVIVLAGLGLLGLRYLQLSRKKRLSSEDEDKQIDSSVPSAKIPEKVKTPAIEEKEPEEVEEKKTSEKITEKALKAIQGEFKKETVKEIGKPSVELNVQKAVEDEKSETEQEIEETEPPKVPSKTLKDGLKKTRGGFITRIGGIFSKKKEIDEDLMDELEEILFTADIGPSTAENLLSHIREALDKKSLGDQDSVWKALKEKSIEILDIPTHKYDFSAHKPFVFLVVGVNGVGKTTSIGKLASRFKSEGRKVMLAAADTFRAAAIDQLEVWAKERAMCEIVKGKEGADPSSVIFEAIKKAQEDDIDILIADTAGRLHTQVNLMDELAKVKRTCEKAMPGAPHETFLVLDATNGQNALHQADMFMKVMDFSGIVITKLDGTAKGGVILGICDRMKVPVKYIGIGEQVEDLRDFHADEFVDALYEREE